MNGFLLWDLIQIDDGVWGFQLSVPTDANDLGENLFAVLACLG